MTTLRGKPEISTGHPTLPPEPAIFTWSFRMDDKIDFSAIHRAGLTQSEFADICEVSRITVNLWVKGKMQPHRYNRDHVAMCILATSDAIKSRKLQIGRAHV